jgi:uncharacterized cupredoxin-like copper-binding protein
METRTLARRSGSINKSAAVFTWRWLPLLVLLTVALGACAGALAGGDPTPVSTANGVQAVNVQATEMRFTPSAIVVHAGQPVELTLTNQGRMIHDLTLSNGVAQPVKILVQPGQAGTSTVTFEPPGTYTFTCAQGGHALLGMTGTITAQ